MVTFLFSNILKDRWKSYQKRYEDARNIGFDEILICLKKIINVIVDVQC